VERARRLKEAGAAPWRRSQMAEDGHFPGLNRAQAVTT
jgi:hypothetical protein